VILYNYIFTYKQKTSLRYL